ncbi:5'-methylthioadenosine/S-adenosylhomocysteine nucleosidase family protein [Nocardiopsis flavescens]
MKSHESPQSNSGIVNMGGTNSFTNTAVGDGARLTLPSNTGEAPRARGPQAAPEERADFGVITILPAEMRAVRDELGLDRPRKKDGLFFSTGDVPTDSGPVSIVATQTHGPGQRSVMAALDHLRHHFAPRLWVLVGIGGGVHSGHARIGNVIVSTRIVYYDARKITAGDRVQRRGEERPAPARIVHAVNAYFTDRGEPAVIRGRVSGHRKRSFEVHHGLIGSGEAVVADGDSEVRHWLKDYNDKILAVDMESGGLSQYWQENSVREADNPGWIVVRGISDGADAAKDDDAHELAAHHAAHVTRELLPYLL